MVRLTDRPDMTLDVYRGRKTATQQQQPTALRGPAKIHEIMILIYCRDTNFPTSDYTLLKINKSAWAGAYMIVYML